MITIRQVQDACCKYFEITRDQILQPYKVAKFAKPRQIAMFLCRDMTGKSLEEIGRHFYRDHTTILHGYRAVIKLRQEDYWDAAIAEIKQDLLDPVGARRKEFEVQMRRLWKESVPHCYAPGAYADEAICHAFLKEAAE
jgi:hypothetical protein